MAPRDVPCGRARRALAAVLVVAALGACGEAPAPARDVVLVVVDTLRADALSSYGNPRPTTPRLDALAAEGLRFEEALAQAPNTATSHASLFTGMAPWTHRVANIREVASGTPGLADEFRTLAEDFRDAGYATAAFTDGGPLGKAWNLMQGFEVHRAGYAGVEAKVDQALEWLGGRAAGGDERPVFLFLHTYEVHSPYLPPPAWRARFQSDPAYAGVLLEDEEAARAALRAGAKDLSTAKILERNKDSWSPADRRYLWDLYLGGLAYTDHHLGRFFDGLDAARGAGAAWLFVTSDHGEEFGEHGDFGHRFLYRETLHVPLVVRPPVGVGAPWEAWRGRVVEERVNLVDVHATLAELVRGGSALQAGVPFQGDLARGAFTARDSFAEVTEGLYLDEIDLEMRSLRRGDHALVWDLRDGVQRRSLQRADEPVVPTVPAGEPEYVDDGAAAGPQAALVQDLARRIEAHLVEASRVRERLLGVGAGVFRGQVDAELEAELRALGYLGDKQPTAE